jgi:ATP-binding cassette subfamily B protein
LVAGTIAGLVLAVGSELAIPRVIQGVIDGGIQPGDAGAILWGSLAIVGITMVDAVFTFLNTSLAVRASQAAAYDMRNDLFTRIQTFSFGNLDHMQTGQLMTRVSSDVDVVRHFLGMGLRLMGRASMLIVGSLILLFLTNWRLALIMLVVMPSAVAVFWLFATKARPLFRDVQQRLAALNTVFQENLAGIEVVKAFAREDHERERFETSNEELMRQTLRVGRLLSVVMPMLIMTANLGTLLVIWVGGLQVIAGSLTLGELVAFNNYLLMTMFPLMMLGMVVNALSSAGASAERILEILDTEAVVRERPDAAEMSGVEGRVAFEGVWFRYDGADGEDVLRDVSFVAEPGQTVALLGATGSGKSTVVNLIPRFYDVTGGRIAIDDVDIRDVTLESLRRQIGMVLQESLLFSGTIRENIAYARPDATDGEVVTAAKAARAHDFIEDMPGGYDSSVGKRGDNLSGGQRQRVAIARALLADPRILVLDDSTSSVDLETEWQIQRSLQTLMRGRTTFIIAQRISSILGADQIVVLEKGRVAACGTHTELLATSSIYQEIYRSQLGGEEETD